MVMLVWALCLETEQHLEEVDPGKASLETKVSFSPPAPVGSRLQEKLPQLPLVWEALSSVVKHRAAQVNSG